LQRYEIFGIILPFCQFVARGTKIDEGKGKRRKNYGTEQQ
jgi:hypothetical protein